MNYKMLFIPAFVLLSTASCSSKEILNLKTKETIDAAIKENKKVIIDYHAEKTCGPCQQMAKILPDLAKAFPKIQFIKVDINEFDVEEIRSVPTFVMYHHQKEVKRFTGSRSKASFTNLINDTFKKCVDTKKKN